MEVHGETVIDYVEDSWINKAINYVIHSDYRNAVNLSSWLKDQIVTPSELLNDYCDKIPTSSDDDLQMLYILKFVRQHFQYMGDLGKWKMSEYWQTAEESVLSNTGDCLRWDTKLLNKKNELINIEDISEGDMIVGKDGKLVKVIKKWDKGILPLKRIILNNGTEIKATDDHKFILSDNSEIRCLDLKIIIELKQINEIKELT